MYRGFTPGPLPRQHAASKTLQLQLHCWDRNRINVEGVAVYSIHADIVAIRGRGDLEIDLDDAIHRAGRRAAVGYVDRDSSRTRDHRRLKDGAQEKPGVTELVRTSCHLSVTAGKVACARGPDGDIRAD